MFDLKLFAILGVISIPGILVVSTKLSTPVSAIERVSQSGRKPPPRTLLATLQTIQSLLLIAGMSAVGVVFAPRAGLAAPVFHAIAHGGSIASALPDMRSVAVVSLGGALIFLLLYYSVFRRWIDQDSLARMEALRADLGVASRILYGGIFEEVFMRWGIVSLLAWLVGTFLSQGPALWTAIVVAGVVFGLGHMPAYFAAGCKKSGTVITAMIVLNLWAGIVFGYLFMRHGLFAAMFSHMIYHLIWSPADISVRVKGNMTESSATRPRWKGGAGLNSSKRVSEDLSATQLIASEVRPAKAGPRRRSPPARLSRGVLVLRARPAD